MRRNRAVAVIASAAAALFALTACQPDSQAGGGSPTLAPVAETSAIASPSASPSTASPSPTPTPSKTVTPSKTTTTSSCQQGPRQKEVETALAKLGTWGPIVVDGHQTDADCATIKKFQKRFGISPANGRAGDTTASVAKRLAATDPAKCQAGTGTVACVDLTHQTTYIMKGGKVIWGPTVTRTGMSGYATPSGWFKIFDRSPKHWSNPYKVWLPYWQQFYNGDGFHETTTYIHNTGIGSHGCVNLLKVDAQKYYATLGYGSKVHLYGRRPGT
ncbi:MAG: L,D-transpeptidase family protein [Hamadaea sp.]|nr:L,D-transpeptidase family protein [Hamadaea sp.]NUR49090.1 L,D-transpeptidase family protein [Hamadaea sp.]NUT07426.1 L,D-transpeptidase family protein [Hamadaea sp.]